MRSCINHLLFVPDISSMPFAYFQMTTPRMNVYQHRGQSKECTYLKSWVFIGRTDVEAETPILWPPHGKS